MNAPAKAKRRTARKRRPGEALPKRATELLAAALELFANEDFNTVTIKDIGASTGVNTALIYYYFDDKADLFAASLEYAVEQALTNYRRLRERHSDPVDLIADWFDNHVQLAKPIRQLVKIMLDYSTSRTQRGVVDAVIKQFYDEECAILSSTIRHGIEIGVFRPVDPERAAHIASTYLDGIMVRSLIHKNMDVAAAMQDLKSLFWEHLGHRAESPRSQVPAAAGSPSRLLASAGDKARR
jgi:TetR/AcrR family transcriptional regulator, upper aerobic nicotinate degradation pathway regulator